MIDAEWFAENSDANFRLRRPTAGEVEAIARASFKHADRDLAALGGTFPPPPGLEWWIMVIAAGGAVIKLLVSRERAAVLKPAAQRAIYAVALGDRVALESHI